MPFTNVEIAPENALKMPWFSNPGEQFRAFSWHVSWLELGRMKNARPNTWKNGRSWPKKTLISRADFCAQRGMRRSAFSVKKRGFQWKGGRQFSEWGVDPVDCEQSTGNGAIPSLVLLRGHTGTFTAIPPDSATYRAKSCCPHTPYKQPRNQLWRWLSL